MKLLLLSKIFFISLVSVCGVPDKFLPDHPDLKESDRNSVPIAKGPAVQVGNITVYQSPYKNESKFMLITIYDIFGFHPHVAYIADKLADADFFVIIPDLFHEDPVPLENFPQPSFAERAQHLFAKNGSWIQNKQDLLNIIRHYKTKYGITHIGMYGFCWGGKISVFAASDEDFNDLNAIGLVHPSRVTNEDSFGITVPTLLLPSKSEPDMLPFLRTLESNAKTNQSDHHRYDTMEHGFAGARSDFSDPIIRKNVEDVILRLSTFFKRVFALK